MALKFPIGATVDRFGLNSYCWRHVQESGSSGLLTSSRSDGFDWGDESPGIDPQALFDYLHFHCIPAPRTIRRGVFRVPAGHRLECGASGPLAVIEQMPSERTPPSRPLQQKDWDALKNQFQDLLAQAVADQLKSTPGACFLSGGTDSSTVAAFIGIATGRPARTFSIGFDAAGYDEMGYARLAAEAFGTDHHEHYVTPEELVETIPAVAASFDQPFGNSSAVPAYCCARVAHKAGVAKLLAGDGGDELFGGNSRYAHLKMLGWYDKLPGSLKTGVLEPLLLGTALGQAPLIRKVASYIRQARIRMPDRMHTYNLLEHLGIHKVLEPRFLSQIDTLSPLAERRRVWSVAEGATELDRILAYDWRYTLAENDLVKVRGATALAGVEVGFPMLDERLVAFSMQLPAAYKLRGLRLRWFFKEALRDLLPPQIIRKRKQGFGLPFGVWATEHRPLFELAQDSVQGTVRRGIVRPGFARDLLDRHLHERPGYYGEMIWILMTLEQWLRAHEPGYQV